MSDVKPIDFWFTMGSTYTFLTVMRLPSMSSPAAYLSVGGRFIFLPSFRK